jgi:four helix bundle protein
MTSHVRRSSRSVAANLAEGYRKRQYPNMFVSKLADCDAEAAETQVGSTLHVTVVTCRRSDTTNWQLVKMNSAEC